MFLCFKAIEEIIRETNESTQTIFKKKKQPQNLQSKHKKLKLKSKPQT